MNDWELGLIGPRVCDRCRQEITDRQSWHWDCAYQFLIELPGGTCYWEASGRVHYHCPAQKPLTSQVKHDTIISPIERTPI